MVTWKDGGNQRQWTGFVSMDAGADEEHKDMEELVEE